MTLPLGSVATGDHQVPGLLVGALAAFFLLGPVLMDPVGVRQELPHVLLRHDHGLILHGQGVDPLLVRDHLVVDPLAPFLEGRIGHLDVRLRLLVGIVHGRLRPALG